jgi:hypothetical protein
VSREQVLFDLRKRSCEASGTGLTLPQAGLRSRSAGLFSQAQRQAGAREEERHQEAAQADSPDDGGLALTFARQLPVPQKKDGAGSLASAAV